MTREKKFTPGPWESEYNGIYYDIMPKPQPDFGRQHLAIVIENGYLKGDNRANSNLIAAAPELLEACECVRADMIARSEGDSTDCSSPEETINYLESAILKAYGETK